MRWTPVVPSQEFDNNLKIEAVSQVGELSQIGIDLNNALANSSVARKMASLCQQERRQILVAKQNDVTTAVALLMVIPGSEGPKFETLFLRSHHNASVNDGPIKTAMDQLVADLNSRQIVPAIGVPQAEEPSAEPVALEAPEETAPAPAEDNAAPAADTLEGPARVVAMAADLNISPLEALLSGANQVENRWQAARNPIEDLIASISSPNVDTDPAPEEAYPEEPRAEHLTWTPIFDGEMTAPNGWKLSPTSSTDDLRRIGEDLHNMLIMEGAIEAMGRRIQAGQMNVVSVSDADGVLRGYLSLAADRGATIVTAGRGFEDKPLAAASRDLIMNFMRNLQSDTPEITLNFYPGMNSFVPANEGRPEVDILEALSIGTGSVPRPMYANMNIHRAIGEMAEEGMGDIEEETADQFEEEIGEVDEGYAGEPVAIHGANPIADMAAAMNQGQSWTPLALNWTDPINGLTVEFVTTDQGLAQLGNVMNNGLVNAGYRSGVAQSCRSGTNHVFAIKNQGQVIANGLITTHGPGDFRRAVVYGPGNSASAGTASLSQEAAQTANSLMNGLQNGVIPVNGTIAPGGRLSPPPAPSNGMGMPRL